MPIYKVFDSCYNKDPKRSQEIETFDAVSDLVAQRLFRHSKWIGTNYILVRMQRIRGRMLDDRVVDDMAKDLSITRFRGAYFFLSNFSEIEIEYEEIKYPTLEHAYQAAKTVSRADKLIIARMSSPVEAKYAGRHVLCVPDWDAKKDEVMLELLRIKFSDPTLQRYLIETGNAELVHGNNHKDTYWGVCDNVGKNKLGNLLMQVRDEIGKGGEYDLRNMQ